MTALVRVLLFLGVFFVSALFNSGLTLEALNNISSTSASISSAIFGFVFASLSILLGLSSSKFISNMSKTGHLNYLLKELRATAGLFLFSVLISLIVIYFPDLYSLLNIANLNLLQLLTALNAAFIALGFSFFISSWKKLNLIISALDRNA